MKTLIVVNSSKTHIHHDAVIIDRVDLTRRSEMINTWVQDALYNDIDVLFIVGDNEQVQYDHDSLTLKLNVNDSYEHVSHKSNLFKKVQEGFRWILDNKEFDIVYLCDDDVYVNIEEFKKVKIEHDFTSNYFLGGSGFFMSKKAMEKIIEVEDYNHPNADTLIFKTLTESQDLTKNCSFNLSTPFYLPAELYITVHYCSGRRAYTLHNTLRTLKESGKTYRKILLGYGQNIGNTPNDVITYESSIGRKTKRWYDYDRDPNGWEYHGGYSRSNVRFDILKKYWPYKEGVSKYFVIDYNEVLKDYKDEKFFYNNLELLVNYCQKSCIDDDSVFLISQEKKEIKGWEVDEKLNSLLGLTFENLKYSYVYKKVKYE